MPEPKNDVEIVCESKTSKILDFFKPVVKETKKDKNKPFTKIVVRRLPPRLTKKEFLAEFALPPHEFFYFVRGDLSMGVHSFSRAYVNLTDPNDTFAFKEKYDDLTVRDEQGKEYHAVVEWSPVQRVPKKSSQKKKMPKSGTLETDPKYIEFLEKLEEEKNNPTNASEYFLETELTSSKEVKITTTPLLEFIKMKRQKKIDMRNEMRQKKREAEKERRRKEDELRKAEKLKKNKDDKDSKVRRSESKEDDKSESNETSEAKELKSDSKSPKVEVLSTSGEVQDKKNDSKSPRSEKGDKHEIKSNRREEKQSKRERIGVKVSHSTEGGIKVKDKGVENIESGKIKKEFEEKNKKTSPVSKKTTSSENRKTEAPRRIEPKSKFRYSEQRNREREVRSQKLEAKRDDNDTKSEDADERYAEESRESSKGSSFNDENKNETGQGDAAKKMSDKDSDGRDPRTERRIRNKDRPSLEIYRPGMGKFSKHRIEQKRDDCDSSKSSSSKSTGASSEPEDGVDKSSPSSYK